MGNRHLCYRHTSVRSTRSCPISRGVSISVIFFDSRHYSHRAYYSLSSQRVFDFEWVPLSGMLAHHDMRDLSFSLSFSLFLSLSFSLIFLLGNLYLATADSRRWLGSNPHVLSTLSHPRVLLRSRSCNLAHSLGMLIKTLLLLLLLLPSLSLLLSRHERVPHEKSCQMAICGVFELHVRSYWLYQKLYILFSCKFLIEIRHSFCLKNFVQLFLFSVLSMLKIGF